MVVFPNDTEGKEFKSLKKADLEKYFSSIFFVYPFKWVFRAVVMLRVVVSELDASVGVVVVAFTGMLVAVMHTTDKMAKNDPFNAVFFIRIPLSYITFS